MTPQEFASQLHKAVVEENTNIYRRLLEKTPVEQASDPYWKRALGLYGSLSSMQREVLFEVIRQVVVDTTSNVLGVIDGVNILENDDEFELLADERKISGDLQSLFLVEEERAKQRG